MRGQSNRALASYAQFSVSVSNDDYRDTYSNYREVYDPVTQDSIGYAIVAGPLPFNWDRTPNYDVHSSYAGDTKENNIFTSNNANCRYLDDLQAEDYVTVVDFRRVADWGIVNGEPNEDSMTNRKYAYVVPTNKPVIIGGTWASYQ